MPIIGIDLGTTNSVVAVMDGAEPRVLLNAHGQRVTPSVVAYPPGDAPVLVGAAARRQAVTNPEGTVASIKRLMGRRWETVRDELDAFSYAVVEGETGDAAVDVGGRVRTPPEIAARVVRELADAARDALGEVDGVVITVPAYFDDAQRQATRRAAEIAGLDVRRILNEPTAAALAAGVADGDGARKIVVFDLGGGTFDVSVLEVDAGVVQVVATAGDTRLGGDDIDARIANWVLERSGEGGATIRGDAAAWQRVRDASERAKIELSSTRETTISLPFLYDGGDGPKHFKQTLTRAELERMIADLVGRAVACCERALEDAGLEKGDIDEVLLVGGSTRVPLVAEQVERVFGRAPSRGLNPDEAVALGAAVQGAVLSGDADLLLLDVTPLTLGVETRGGVVAPIIPRNAAIPTRASKTVSTATADQRAVEIHVVQGERPLAADNRSLGRFELTGIPPMAAGAAKIDVLFEVDASGIVSVSARETTTGKEASIRISGAGGVTDEAVARLIAEAEDAAKADAERRGLIERRNQLEATVLQLERRVAELGDDVAEASQPVVEQALTDARSALVGDLLSAAKYMEINNDLIAAATLVEDDGLAAAARRKPQRAAPNPAK